MTKKVTNSPITLPADFHKQFKGKDDFLNFFQDLFKRGVEQMLQGELDAHLGYEKHDKSPKATTNTRNGYSDKTVKTHSVGDMLLRIPRDRQATFEPQLVPKHQRMSGKIEEAILSMYARGMCVRDIATHIDDVYGVSVSSSTISTVTHRILEDVKAWQNRPLEATYFALWMDGIVVKVRDNGKILNKTILLVIGLNKEGKKEVLGMWIRTNEGATFWLEVLTDLQARGVEHVCIACCDNLAGFQSAIESMYPHARVQLCVAHQIRNSCRYVVYRDRKAFIADLKVVYGAPTKSAAEDQLLLLEEKWGSKYGYAIKSWQDNWAALSTYFEYPQSIRKVVYTTNTIESLNSTIRKYTRNKTVFPDDQAALKSVYLAIQQAEKNWTMPIPNWGLALNQFMIIFGNDMVKKKE